ncbi:alpha-galactosidase [Nocardioides sp. BE266]|uniref:alpha-galactosidase n=1 Tax=Nocardioides sp. BE266 TaxID=2817725 RepID=UPI0028552D22|nr:alpha-galactosidase [Nocardioides sp. BE266]MDR7254812.1 alpha-galactosidase [Nocardioides sp. BE266]
MTADAFAPVHLNRRGVSVVVASDDDGVPVLLHWGASLGDPSLEALADLVAARRPGVSHSAYDRPRTTGLVPEVTKGFSGTPALEGHRVGGESAALPRLSQWSCEPDADGPDTGVRLTGIDEEAGWSVEVRLLLSDAGLLRARTAVTNTRDGVLHLAGVRTALPVGAHASELLDLTGRWCLERAPQRHPWVQGTHRRDGRHGRTGHDATLLMVAGTPGFGFSHGEVWGVHTAWSGDHTTYAERTAEGDCLLGGGELLAAGEVALEPGETYVGPWLLGSWSGEGLDPMSHRLHDHLRARSPRSRTERPVVANTWEAVYFDHDLDRLTHLADVAASAGVERFVLDDGWFLGRRAATAGLGDWTVDPEVWPNGLHPLVDHVRGLGMQFGLWVEPEMVNLDSEVARDHPERVLRGHSEPPASWRDQQVLDLQDEAAYASVRDALLALLDEYDIAYLKWDHNRDLTDATHGGRPAVHGQTLALHRLLDELHTANPTLEIESCSSGGARVDAAILEHTDRIWPSDTIDPLERQSIQRWTSLLVPPELMGSHVGGPVAHTTGRSHRLGYRAATALLYSFGVEWDVTGLDPLTLDALGRWIELHKQVRPLIGTGTLVHPDHADPGVMVTGLVAADRSEAWYVVATVASTATQHPAALRLTGLDPDRTYRIADVTATADQHDMGLTPWWAASGEQALPGRVLATAGVSLPVMAPESARVLRLVAT